MTAERLGRGTVLRYATGSVGTGGFNTLPGLVLLYYLTDALAVTAVVAGLVVSLTKIWDVVIDPAIGAASDVSRLRTGTRTLFMRVGASSIGVLFVLTFAAPAGTAWAALWVAVAFMAAATAFSTFQIPYLALAAEITDSYDERTRLQTWRLVVLTAAILVFGGALPAVRDAATEAFGGLRAGYLTMAVVAALLISVSMWVAARSAEVTRIQPSAAPRLGLRARVRDGYRAGWAALRSSQPFRALLTSFVLKSVAMGIMLAVGQYIATWVLQDRAAITIVFVALIGPALLVTPLWGRAAIRWGKEPLVYVAGAVFTGATLAMVLLIWFPGAWFYGVVALAGLGYAGLQALPLSILPDVVAFESRRQRTANAGSFTGMWTAGETLGLALGPLVLSALLQAGGYVSSAGGDVTQPGSAIVAICLGISVVPAALVILSLIAFRGYRLRRADVEHRSSQTLDEGISPA